jgi:hypothetical protein
MSKRKSKSVFVNAEVLEAADAIASISNQSVGELVDRFLLDYVMDNMSLLVGELQRLGGTRAPGPAKSPERGDA